MEENLISQLFIDYIIVQTTSVRLATLCLHKIIIYQSIVQCTFILLKVK